MGFSLFEIAARLGRPVRLYKFAWGPTVWRYTSADRDVEYGLDADGVTPIVWEAIAISDSGFTQGESSQDFTITLPRSLPVCQLFNGTPPSTEISVNVFTVHRDDADEEVRSYWKGSIGNLRGVDAVKSEIIGLPLSGKARRTGLRLCWDRSCPHMLYDGNCRADKELFKSVATITGVGGASITVDTIGAFAGEAYAGGVLEWEATAEGAIDRRAIESFAGGTTFNLLGTSDRLEIGQQVSLYLGCDLSPQTCRDRFDNMENFGGFTFLAGKSPFDGDPVF